MSAGRRRLTNCKRIAIAESRLRLSTVGTVRVAIGHMRRHMRMVGWKAVPRDPSECRPLHHACAHSNRAATVQCSCKVSERINEIRNSIVVGTRHMLAVMPARLIKSSLSELCSFVAAECKQPHA